MAQLRYHVDEVQAPRVTRLLRSRGVYLIGAGPDADIVVEAEGSPAKLAKVEHHDGKWRVSGFTTEVDLRGEQLGRATNLESGDTLRWIGGGLLRFFDGAEWVRDVAPWAAVQTPEVDEVIKSDVVIVSAQEAQRRGIGPVDFCFDLVSTGLVAAWRRSHLAVVKTRPPGPERAVVEGVAGQLDGKGLMALVEERVGDAQEVALSKLQLSSWEDGDQFGWQPLAGGQCHAVRVAWQRGLFTTVVWVPANNRSGLLVSFTSPAVDPYASQCIGQLMRTFALGNTPRTLSRAHIEICDGEQAGRRIALDERKQYVLGSGPGCDLVVHHEALRKQHARLLMRGNRWVFVATTAALELTRVNHAPATENGDALTNGDQILVESPASSPEQLVIKFYDDVFKASKMVVRAKPMVLWPVAKASSPVQRTKISKLLRVTPGRPLVEGTARFTRMELLGCGLPAFAFSLFADGMKLGRYEERIVFEHDRVKLSITGYQSPDHGPQQLNLLLDERAACAPRSWAGRRLKLGKSKWSYFGQVFRLRVGSNHLRAVMPDSDTCATLLPAPNEKPEGFFLMLKGDLITSAGFCEPAEPNMARALESWTWLDEDAQQDAVEESDKVQLPSK